MKFGFDLTLACIVIIIVLAVIYVLVQENNEVDRCFMQEPRTKECELVLYKYENRTKRMTTVMPMPIVVK